jgi:hypothetical protein
MNAFRYALLTFALLATPSFATASTANLTPSKDTSIFDGTAFTNNSAGGQTKIYVGSNGMSPFPARRDLLEFDLTSIPAGSVITDVSLTLTLDSSGSTVPRLISIYRTNTEWGEGSVSSGGGNGGTAGAGDATWNSSQNPTAWGTPGGDHDPTASASFTVAGEAPGTTFTLLASSNPTLLSDVQSWFGDATSNHGWELINSAEGASQSVKSFSSKEAAAGIRPLLSITYTPEPAALGMVIMALLLGLLHRRRKSSVL